MVMGCDHFPMPCMIDTVPGEDVTVQFASNEIESVQSERGREAVVVWRLEGVESLAANETLEGCILRVTPTRNKKVDSIYTTTEAMRLVLRSLS